VITQDNLVSGIIFLSHNWVSVLHLHSREVQTLRTVLDPQNHILQQFWQRILHLTL